MDLRYAIFAQEDDGRLVRIFKDRDWHLEVEAWQYAHGSRTHEDQRAYTVLKIMVG